MKKLAQTSIAIGILLGIPATSLSQTTDPTRVGPSPRDELELPPAQLRPPPDRVFELPPLPEIPEERLETAEKIRVERIEITGNTVLDDATLAELAAPYEGRDVTLEELFRLKDEISRTYIEAGYISSGAVLPDQEVTDGVVRIEVVEGTLEAVDIAGTDRLDSGFLEDRVRLGAGPPLNVGDLQERLQLLLLEPSIQRLDGKLGPGSGPGSARLELDVAEAPAYDLELRFSNDQSPSIGANHGEIIARARDILGRGDIAALQVGLTEGLKEASLDVRVPLTPSGLTFHTRLEHSDSDLIGDDVKALDIESRTTSLTVGLALPVVETLSDRVDLDLSLVREHNETYLLGDPFSFSPGFEDGEADLTLLRFAQTWQSRGRNLAFSLGSTFTVGLNALGATNATDPIPGNDGEVPDGQFFGWLLQGEVGSRLFTETDQLVARGELQLVDRPILPSEQVASGGLDSVRGYRVNELVRDNGWKGSVEYRYPVLDLADRERDWGLVELIPFVDAAGGFNDDDSVSNAKDDMLLSAGIGARYHLPPSLTAELYWGYAFLDNDKSASDGDSIQDAGIGFRIRWSPFAK